MGRIDDVFSGFIATEHSLRKQRTETTAAVFKLTVWLAVGLAVVIGIVLALIAGRQLARLNSAYGTALREAKEAAAVLERRVTERTAELSTANAQMLRAGESLRITNERLNISNRELQDFASIASHDLQEPLRKVQAFGDRLRAKAGEPLGPESIDYLDRMLNAVARMKTLINDLLSFARVTSRAQPFHSVDLQLVVRQVLTDLETRIEQTNAIVEVDDLPVIEGDVTQMRQIFQNLIGNALKFCKRDEPARVRVECESETVAGNPWIRLTVRDNGIGFDEKYLDRIFTVFQRLHGRNEYEGTGIGLTICRKIVERHGGKITARSRPGEGAAFIISLPLKQPALDVNHAIVGDDEEREMTEAISA
ncbi:MAG: hypothetical protein JO353_01770 [Phycisphaerae bacterium]|nr:hypothetical protein [Phycisphaerae bacterium]